MEPVEITLDQGKFVVKGFPDAVKVLKLEGPKAKRLADLALHETDLGFALNCLEDINKVPTSNHTVREAVWRSAVVHYTKCFGKSESRFKLVAGNVYKDNAEAIDAYRHFASLRNKHLVHDENSWTQCIPGAVLNKDGAESKIVKVVSVAVIAQTLDQSHYNNLHTLITLAKKWVVHQYDELCAVLMRELEVENYENLIAREGIVYIAPDVAEIHESRTSK